jgi:hypothetical protein
MVLAAALRRITVGGAAGSGRGAPDRSASQAAGHGGFSPVGAAASRGGHLLLSRLTAVVRSLAAKVKLEHKAQQVVKDTSRVGAVVVLALTRPLLLTPLG